MYDLGLRLKEIRIQRGLTQKSLARRINKSISAVSSYESNAQMPPLDVLISIASVFNISLDNLVGLDGGEIYTAKNLTAGQKEILDLLFSEFTSPSSANGELSPQQIRILQKIIRIFSAQQSGSS